MPNSRFSRRGMLTAAAGALLVPAAVRAERKQTANEYFEVTRVEIFMHGLDPAHDGLVVGQLSDLHIGSGVPDGRVISAVLAMNEEKPDLIALTGDFVTNRWDPYDRVPDLLKHLEAPAFAVLGNHDYWSDPALITSLLEKEDFTVLKNQHTTFRIKGADFTVLGVDDSTTKHDDVEATFKGNPKGSRLVLTHTPNCAQKLPPWEDVLCLSGHTHGGQWSIPRLTEGIFKKAGQPYFRGYYRVRGNQLYVNRGLGFGKGSRLPRLNSDPELTLFTLRVATV